MSIPSSEAKSARRLMLRAERRAMHVDERARKDAEVARRLIDVDEWHRAHIIYAYLSFSPEVDTRRIIREAWRQGKQVAIPYCIPRTRRMRWFVIDSFDGLVRNALGVEEPIPDENCEMPAEGERDALALVPALCYDEHGYRLGYGGGFYDVFLARFVGVPVGLCHENALVRDLLAEGLREPHDRSVHLVVSDARVIRPDQPYHT